MPRPVNETRNREILKFLETHTYAETQKEFACYPSAISRAKKWGETTTTIKLPLPLSPTTTTTSIHSGAYGGNILDESKPISNENWVGQMRESQATITHREQIEQELEDLHAQIDTLPLPLTTTTIILPNFIKEALTTILVSSRKRWESAKATGFVASVDILAGFFALEL